MAHGFKADPDSIGQFGNAMERLVHDTDTAKRYSNTWLDVGFWDSAIFATVASAASDAKAALEDYYSRLGKIQQAAATELEKVAAMYRKTDQDNAEELDHKYPAGGAQ